jgi:hypothetical protein
MAHLQAVAPQVVVTHPIAARIQVVHQLHAAIHRVQVRAHLPIAGSVVTVHATRAHQVTAQPVARTVIVIHVLHPIVLHVHTVTATRVQVPVRLQIVLHVHTVIEIPVHLPVRHQIAANAATVHATHDQVRVRLPIAANAVTVQEIHDHHQIVPIVHPVHMVTDQNVVTIVDQVLIVQQVVHTVIAIPDLRHVQVPDLRQIEENAVTVHATRAHQVTAQLVAHTEIATHAHQVTAQLVAHTEIATHAHLPIVHVVARRVDRQIDAMTVILDRAIHDPRQINPAEATHTVAIAHAQAMTATRVRLRVTANAVVVQIVPEVVSPMIAKSVHAAALAKSA